MDLAFDFGLEAADLARTFDFGFGLGLGAADLAGKLSLLRNEQPN